MDLANYAVNAVLVEGRSVRAVAGATGTVEVLGPSPRALFRAGGSEALVPAAGPQGPGNLTGAAVEDEIVWWRKRLGDAGLDAGARTIR